MYAVASLAVSGLLLPLVAAGHGAPLHHRAVQHDRHLAHARHPPTARDLVSLEARLAKRASGRQLARRGADPKQCRPRHASSSSLAQSSTAPPSSAAATSTSTWVAASSSSSTGWDNNEAYAWATSTSTTNWWATTSAAAAAASSAAYSSSSSSSAWTSPNGIKAGISAGDAYDYMSGHIGWWYDWSPNPSGHSGSPVAVPMLWGAGTVDSTDAERYAAFEALSYNPTWIIGFEEPDCYGSGSAGIDTAAAAVIWDALVAPHGWAGSLLLSPSMCHQAAETWLQPFEALITKSWDITNIHINKNSAAGIQADIDHYWNTYGKPMWVTEFACVDDSTGFVPCTDQSEINSFINTAVGIFESDYRVVAYAYSNGAGLGDVWPLMSSSGSLSESGQTYLSAISAYH